MRHCTPAEIGRRSIHYTTAFKITAFKITALSIFDSRLKQLIQIQPIKDLVVIVPRSGFRCPGELLGIGCFKEQYG